MLPLQQTYWRQVMDRVLIVADEGDDHADHIERLLVERGAEVIMFDPTRFPASAALSVAVSSSGVRRGRITMDGRKIDLDTLTSVWLRRPLLPVAHSQIVDVDVRRYVEKESAVFATDVWDTLNCRVLPASRATMDRAAHKLLQLIKAGREGFELPPTLVTTDPDEFLDFYREYDGNIITKVLDQRCAHHRGDEFDRYTEPVSPADVAYADSMRLCPIIVQSYVSKAVELRITVVGAKVFAAEIESQKTNHTRHDWRQFDPNMSYRIHHLPDAVNARCVRLVQRLGLAYGAIDMILTPDERYVFLEMNPDGQYLWIEDLTGLAISDSICEFLLVGAR